MKIKHTHIFTIDYPIDNIFPLFSAEGEKLWVPGWEYENIMGYNGLHEDYIFLTESHDHASAKAIWIVKRYDPESHFVQFYKIEPDNKVGIITVQCREIQKEKTSVEVSYEYIALSKKGEEFIKTFTKTEYDSYINSWKTLLENYLSAK